MVRVLSFNSVEYDILKVKVQGWVSFLPRVCVIVQISSQENAEHVRATVSASLCAPQKLLYAFLEKQVSELSCKFHKQREVMSHLAQFAYHYSHRNDTDTV